MNMIEKYKNQFQILKEESPSLEEFLFKSNGFLKSVRNLGGPFYKNIDKELTSFYND